MIDQKEGSAALPSVDGKEAPPLSGGWMHREVWKRSQGACTKSNECLRQATSTD